MNHFDSIADLDAASFPPSEAERLRLALLPSFHAPLLIDVEVGSTTEIAVVRRASPNWVELEECPREATLSFHRAIMELVDKGLLGSKSSLGIDGMIVLGELRAHHRPTRRFEAWSPSPGTLPHAFAHAFYTFAGAHVPSERVQATLEQVHGYLGLGLPLKKFNESPERVRVFGSLSTTHESELRAALRSISPYSPLVMDFSNCDGMGAALYPLFRELLKRKGRTVWVASAGAARHLQDIGVPRGSVFSNVFDARRAAL